MTKHLQTVFHAMHNTRLGKLLATKAPRELTPEHSVARQLQAERDAESKARSAVIAAKADQHTRQRKRYAERRGAFAGVTEKWNLPRRQRRAIARDILKRERTAAKQAA